MVDHSELCWLAHNHGGLLSAAGGSAVVEPDKETLVSDENLLEYLFRHILGLSERTDDRPRQDDYTHTEISHLNDPKEGLPSPWTFCRQHISLVPSSHIDCSQPF